VYAVLTVSQAGVALAQQQMALPQPNPAQINLPVIHCTQSDKGLQGPKPCETTHTSDRVQYASDVTQEELACTLSGVCGATGRTGVQGRVDDSGGA
jgi:hypothetical protein